MLLRQLRDDGHCSLDMDTPQILQMHLTANKHLYYELHSQLNANYSSKKMQSQTSKMLLEKGIGHKDPTRFWKIMDIVSRRLHSARQDIERNKLVEREYLLLNQVELEEESRANHQQAAVLATLEKELFELQCYNEEEANQLEQARQANKKLANYTLQLNKMVIHCQQQKQNQVNREQQLILNSLAHFQLRVREMEDRRKAHGELRKRLKSLINTMEDQKEAQAIQSLKIEQYQREYRELEKEYELSLARKAKLIEVIAEKVESLLGGRLEETISVYKGLNSEYENLIRRILRGLTVKVQVSDAALIASLTGQLTTK